MNRVAIYRSEEYNPERGLTNTAVPSRSAFNYFVVFQNIMTFNKCSINGVVYGDLNEVRYGKSENTIKVRRDLAARIHSCAI